jgi:hypothetical protein
MHLDRTALALAPLSNFGWSIAHDVVVRRDCIDHLVIGPGGTFAIDTRVVTGAVRVDRDQVTTTAAGRSAFPSDLWAHESRGHAAEANKMLSNQLAQRVPVAAVVVIWGDFPQRRVDGHNVTFIHGDELAAWLRAHPARLELQLASA